MWSKGGLRAALALLLGIAVVGAAPAAEEAAIGTIRSLYARINGATEQHKTQETLFYAEEDETKAGGAVKWLRCESPGCKDSFEQSGSKARTYSSQGAILKAVLIDETPSGDWDVQQQYYFYPDGRTAFVYEKTVTFQGYDSEHDRDLPPGPYVLEKRIYFDEAGKEIRSLKRAIVSSSGKEIPARYVHDLEFEVWPDVRSLPFGSLLPK